MSAQPVLLLVNGSPATGKTRLAGWLADQLGWPLVSKDAIKERLYDELGAGDRDESSRQGRAAYAVMYGQIEALLRAGVSAVVDAPLKREFEQQRVERLVEQFDCTVVQVVLRTDREVLLQRYRARGASAERHPGHQVLEEDVARLGGLVPLDLPRTIAVETTDFRAVDYDDVLKRVNAAF